MPDTALPLVEGSVGDTLRRVASCFPDHQALTWPDGDEIVAMSYRELLEQAERVAQWLLGIGVPGDRIAIWSCNSVEWILAEYGAALAGMVIASWNPGWTDHECSHADELTQPVAVLAGFDTRGTPLLDRAIALSGAGRVHPLAQLSALAPGAPVRDLPKPSGLDLFLLQFTSGTTGRAKASALSHRAALNSAWLRFAAMGADDTDVIVNPSPLNHMGGAITMLLGCLVVAACYVIMPRFDAGEVLRLMRRCGGTRIGGVPTMLYALLDHPDWDPGTFSIRSIGAGGAQVPQPLIDRLMRETQAPVLVAYAQSECPMITSSVPGDPQRLLTETVGRVSPHVELKVVDQGNGRLVARGETGEVCVRTPVMMDGYYRMAEATAATIGPDGFLRTGDLGSLDSEGFVRIRGRAREVIIRGGENIYPAEVEDALLNHPAVEAVAVVGVPDDRWGQQVGAAVRLRKEVSTSLAELEGHAARRLAHFKVPRVWKFVDAFPLTASGKIRKVDVEAWFREVELKT